MRRLICILLLMCLPLQSFAFQVGSSAAGTDMSFAHEILHDEKVQHHHDDDGSVHYDDSAESAQHIQDHSCSQQPVGFWVPKMASPPEQRMSVTVREFSRFIPDPFLDSPLRPPARALG